MILFTVHFDSDGVTGLMIDQADIPDERQSAGQIKELWSIESTCNTSKKSLATRQSLQSK